VGENDVSPHEPLPLRNDVSAAAGLLAGKASSGFSVTRWAKEPSSKSLNALSGSLTIQVP
jgi:hypothetical protein